MTILALFRSLFRRRTTPPAPPPCSPSRAVVLRLATLAAAHPRHAMAIAATALRPGATPQALDAELVRATDRARLIDRQLATEAEIAAEAAAAQRLAEVAP